MGQWTVDSPAHLLAGPASVWAPDVQTGHSIDGWFSSVERFLVIRLDVVCVSETPCAPF